MTLAEKRTLARERAAEARRLRAEGMTWRAVGVALGISRLRARYLGSKPDPYDYDARNREIRRRHAAGETREALSLAFGLCDMRIWQIVSWGDYE